MSVNNNQSWFTMAQIVTEIVLLANNRMLERFVNFVYMFALIILP